MRQELPFSAARIAGSSAPSLPTLAQQLFSLPFWE